MLKQSSLDTPLGKMIVIANETTIHLLDFADSIHITNHLKQWRSQQQESIPIGKTKVMHMIEQELALYFAGDLTSFKTPFHMLGTDFQKKSWNYLTQIPYGTTHHYATQATKIGHAKSYRAVANANRANPLVILIPCHRIIRKNNSLGGYRGGIQRKKWLLDHEKKPYIQKILLCLPLL